jgi:hypothetical protein
MAEGACEACPVAVRRCPAWRGLPKHDAARSPCASPSRAKTSSAGGGPGPSSGPQPRRRQGLGGGTGSAVQRWGGDSAAGRAGRPGVNDDNNFDNRGEFRVVLAVRRR